METVYRRSAIDYEADLSDGLKKLAALEDSLKGTLQPCGNVTGVSHSSRLNSWDCAEIMAEGARFELADPLRGLQFSRLARSATPSPLRMLGVV
jgi:hypothetical protein